MGTSWSDVKALYKDHLTDKTGGKKRFLVIGTHRNGKTTFLNTIEHTSNWDKHKGMYQRHFKTYEVNAQYQTTLTIEHLDRHFTDYNFTLSDFAGLMSDNDVKALDPAKIVKGVVYDADTEQLVPDPTKKIDGIFICIAADAKQTDIDLTNKIAAKFHAALPTFPVVGIVTRIDAAPNVTAAAAQKKALEKVGWAHRWHVVHSFNDTNCPEPVGGGFKYAYNVHTHYEVAFALTKLMQAVKNAQ